MTEENVNAFEFLKIGLGASLLLTVFGLLISAFVTCLAVIASFDGLLAFSASASVFVVGIAAVLMWAITSAFREQQYHIEHKQELEKLKAARPVPVLAAPVAVEPARAVDLRVETTNAANTEYWQCRKIIEAMYSAIARTSDGEKLTSKPFSFRTLRDAGLSVTWDDWGRLIDRIEEAGILQNARAKSNWSILVRNPALAVTKLNDLFNAQGFILVNNVWMRR